MPQYGGPLAGVCVSTAVFVCGAAGFPSAPAELPTSSGPLQMTTESGTTASVPMGSELVLEGDGYAGNASVSIVVYSEPTELGATVADETGRVTAVVDLPDDLTGRHTVTAIGNGADGQPRALQMPIEVIDVADAAGAGVADVPSGPLDTLPRTGVSLAALFFGGLGMVVAGFVLVRSAVFRRKLLPEL